MVRIKTKQKKAVAQKMKGLEIPPMPLFVSLVRIGPVRLDDDNLRAACKYVRDEIARIVGVDDGSPLYTWDYKQRIGKYGVDVEIVTRGDGL